MAVTLTTSGPVGRMSEGGRGGLCTQPNNLYIN